MLLLCDTNRCQFVGDDDDEHGEGAKVVAHGQITTTRATLKVDARATGRCLKGKSFFLDGARQMVAARATAGAKMPVSYLRIGHLYMFSLPLSMQYRPPRMPGSQVDLSRPPELPTNTGGSRS